MQVEIDPDAAEKLVIGRADFLHALENDVKPAFGASQEMLETFLARGVQVWGQPVQDVLDDGHLLIQQVTSLKHHRFACAKLRVHDWRSSR